VKPRRFVSVLFAAFAAASTALAQAPAADPVLRDFEPNGEYVLSVDGHAVADAEILRSDRAPAFLVISKQLANPVLLQPRAGSASSVPAAALERRADGMIDVRAGTVPTPLGKLTIQGDSAGWDAAGHAASLGVKPPLVGLHAGIDLEKYNPLFGRRANLYTPKAEAVATLRGARRPVTVRIVFGSWCPHCQQKVPYVLRLERELKGSPVTFEYYGLPRPPDAWKDAEVLRLGINTVPVAVVSVAGREVGRVLSAAWDAPEVVLARIVAGIP
jgi:thiol-disulfide isomerase/thioredoxin